MIRYAEIIDDTYEPYRLSVGTPYGFGKCDIRRNLKWLTLTNQRTEHNLLNTSTCWSSAVNVAKTTILFLILTCLIVWWCHNMVEKSKFLPKKNIFIKVPITAMWICLFFEKQIVQRASLLIRVLKVGDLFQFSVYSFFHW